MFRRREVARPRMELCEDQTILTTCLLLFNVSVVAILFYDSMTLYIQIAVRVKTFFHKLYFFCLESDLVNCKETNRKIRKAVFI